MEQVTGIIMAGGKSSRMGEDKGLMIYKGNPMISYPLSVLQGICGEIIISTNNIEYSRFGYRLIDDAIKGIGPIGGLYSSLMASKNEWNLVVACDMPFVSESFLRELIAFEKKGFNALVPQNTNKQYEALCALYSKSCIPIIENQIKKKEFGLYQLLNKLHVNKLSVSIDNRNFINLNTLNEFREAESGI